GQSRAVRRLKEGGRSASRRFGHRNVGELAAVSAHKLIKGFDAVIAIGVSITVDGNETSASDINGGQCTWVDAPPFLDLLRISGYLFLPARKQRSLVRSRWKNRQVRSGQIEGGS